MLGGFVLAYLFDQYEECYTLRTKNENECKA